MRKWLALLLAVLLLTGCARQQAAQSETDTVHVGLCLRGAQTGVPYPSLTAALEARGWQISLVDAGEDQTVQNHQVSQFGEAQLDLLIIEPVMWDGVQQLLELLQSLNMPAVFVGENAQTDALEGFDRICYVGSKNECPGIAQAQLLLQTESKGDLNGDGVVSYGVLAGPAELQVTGALLEAYAQSLPQGTLLQAEYSALGKDEGKLLCSRLLTRFGPDLEVLFCHSDELALGALAALEEAGRTPGTDVLVIGSGASREALEQIREHRLTGTVRADPQMLQEAVVTAAEQLLTETDCMLIHWLDWQAVDRHKALILLAE